MIEIVKEGNLPKKHTTCSECQCEFTYTDGDINYDCKHYEFGHHETWWIVCPCCGHKYDPEYEKPHPRKVKSDKPWWKFW